MDLSVIVVNYNAGPFVEQCLASVQQWLIGIQHEVCVVDNASMDGSPALIRNRFPQVRLLLNSRNVGFAAAINEGLRETRGRYVLWLNPDAELLDAGITTLLEYLNANSSVGILGPQLIDPDGSIQLSCRSFPSYQTVLSHRYSLLTHWVPLNAYSRHYLLTEWDHASVREVDWVSGACLLHRREILEKVGNLDEQFFMYCEDVDFCFRTKQAGWSVQYHPAMKVVHHIAGSSRHVSRRMIVEHHRSMWRYYTKHFSRNSVKDTVTSMGIAVHCAVKLMSSFLPKRNHRSQASAE